MKFYLTHLSSLQRGFSKTVLIVPISESASEYLLNGWDMLAIAKDRGDANTSPGNFLLELGSLKSTSNF